MGRGWYTAVVRVQKTSHDLLTQSPTHVRKEEETQPATAATRHRIITLLLHKYRRKPRGIHGKSRRSLIEFMHITGWFSIVQGQVQR